MRSPLCHAFVFASCALIAACQSKPWPESERRPAPSAVLLGEVRLARGSSMPQYADLDLVRRPLHVHDQPRPPDECAQAQLAARSTVLLTPEGRLAGVSVAASDFTRVPQHKPQTHRLFIEHCRLTPALIAATTGDLLSIENRDAYVFEPLLGPAFTAQPLPRGKPSLVPVGAAGVDSLQCSLGAPCGRTDLLVFFHPVHAVTDGAGRFRIENFPAQELVRVTAWHPLFEVSENFVWLEVGQVGTLTLEMVPKRRFVDGGRP